MQSQSPQLTSSIDEGLGFFAEGSFLDIRGSRKEVRDWCDWWVRLEQIHIRVFVLGVVVVKKYLGLWSQGEYESVKLPEFFLGQRGGQCRLHVRKQRDLRGTERYSFYKIVIDTSMVIKWCNLNCALSQDREEGGKKLCGGAESLLPFTQALWGNHTASV